MKTPNLDFLRVTKYTLSQTRIGNGDQKAEIWCKEENGVLAVIVRDPEDDRVMGPFISNPPPPKEDKK